MSNVTQADLTRFSQELANGDRAGFYLDYYNVTGDSQVLSLALISSFSGVPGGAADIANQIDAAIAQNYPSDGVESFSLQIAQNILNAVQTDVAGGGTGILSNTTILNTAQSTWTNLGLSNYFPGNALAVEALLTGNWAYFEQNSQSILTIGTAVGLFSGGAAAINETQEQQEQLYYQAVTNFANEFLGANISSTPPGTTSVTSTDGQVSWLVNNSTGNVVYGSVKTPSLFQFPELSDSVQMQIPNFSGTSQTQLFLNLDDSGSIVSDGQTLNYTPQDLLSLNFATSGTVQATVTPNSGAGSTETIDLSNTGTTADIDGQSYFVGLPNATTSLDALGDVTFTTPASNGVSSTVTVPVNGSEVALTATSASGTATLDVGASSLQSVTTDSNGNLDITTSSSGLGGSDGFLWNQTTGDISVNIPGTNGTISALDLGDLTAGETLNSTGSLFTVTNGTQTLESAQVNSNGSYSNTIINDTNTTVYNYNAFGQLTTSDRTYVNNGGSSQTVYSQNDSDAWQSQTNAYNSSGQLIGTVTVNRDGTSLLQTIDPTTGDLVLGTTLNSDGQIIQEVPGPAATTNYNAFVQAIGDTLATQIITNFLIQKDLPASIGVQAFADAVIGSAASSSPTNPVTFAEGFASSAFDIAGGIAGSDVGDIVAQALGLPSEVGTLVGGAAGNVITQALVQQAQESLGIAQSGQDLLTTEELAANLSSGLAAGAGGLAGSELASLILPASLGGEIAGAVATTAAFVGTDVLAIADGIFATSPVGAVLLVFSLAFESNFLGNLIGDVFEDIFGGLFGGQPSVGPNATAWVQYVNQQFALTESGADNGGDVTIAQSLATTTANILNSINSVIGGTISNPSSIPTWGLGYFKGQFFATNETTDPEGYQYNQFANSSDAVNSAVINLLSTEQISGGNPYMVYVLRTSSNTTVDGLVSDLNVARDYSAYVANPAAFNLSLAMSGDATEYQTWQTELARAQVLGLPALANTGYLDPTTAPGSSVTESGSVINFGNSVQAVVNGTNNIVNLGTNAVVTLNGSSNTANMGTGDTVSAASDTLALGSNASGTINGLSNTVTLGANAQVILNGIGDQVGVSSGDNVVATGDELAIGPSASSVVITGNGNAISAAQGDSFTVSGMGDYIATGTDDTLTVTSTGINNTVSLAAGSTLNLTGDGGTQSADSTVVYMANGSTLNEQSNTLAWVSGSDETVNVSANSTLGLTGADNTVTAGADDTVICNSTGAGNYVALGTGGTLDLTGDGGTASADATIVNMSTGATLNEQSGTLAWVTASQDAINIGASSTIALAGLGDTITTNTGDSTTLSSTGAGNTLELGTDNWVSLTGDGGTSSADATVVYMGTGGTLDEQSNTLAYVNASSDTVSIGSNSTIALTGAGNYIASSSSDSVTVTSNGAENVLALGTNNWVSLTGDGGTSSADATVVSVGNNSTFNEQSNTLAYVTASSSQINMAATSTIALSGTGDTITTATSDSFTITSTGTGNTATLGANNWADLVGNGNSVTAANYDTILVSGDGSGSAEDNITMSSGTIDLAANAQAKITGTGDIIDFLGAASNQLWFQRSGNDLIVDVLGTTETVDVANWFNHETPTTTFETSDGLKLDSQITALESAMATYSANNTSFNPQTATAMPTNSTLNSASSAAWHH